AAERAFGAFGSTRGAGGDAGSLLGSSFARGAAAGGSSCVAGAGTTTGTAGAAPVGLDPPDIESTTRIAAAPAMPPRVTATRLVRLRVERGERESAGV